MWSFMTWILMPAVILGQKRPSVNSSSGFKSDCVGNLMRLTLDKALAVGSQLEVEAISDDGSQHIHLTPILAAQCGYSMESDPWGNTRIYTSLMGCYVDNHEDDTFNVSLRLRMYNNTSDVVVIHDISQTCEDSSWNSEEILCDRNYMEVSKLVPDIKDEEGQDMKLQDDSKIKAVPGTTGAAHGIWKMTFHTPEPVAMLLKEAQEAGFGAMTTSSRLVLRSSYNTARTYTEDVAGVPMEVFKVSTYYKLPRDIIVINSAAACPVGGVLFTENMISWHVPRRITPLINGGIKVFEMHMGINGQRLDKSQMAARGYTLSATESHIITELPIGSPDGYYKSHAPDYQYHITYTVEPMLELLWWSEDTQADTKYKVLFPITTPLTHQPLHFSDSTLIKIPAVHCSTLRTTGLACQYTQKRHCREHSKKCHTDLAAYCNLETIPELRVFSILLGTFLHDVELVNITFSTGVLTVDECNAKGLDVQEYTHSNGSKTFVLHVPFSDNVVLKRNPEPWVTVYLLPLTYEFVIQPEQTLFSYTLEVEQSVRDVVLPSITGTCDQNMFYISVKYGSQGHNFQAILGNRELSRELAEVYKLTENGTHFSLVVPYNSPDTAFELIESSSVKARADLLLWEPNNEWKLADFSLACNFPLTTTECHANGTVTALAVKVESVPTLIPSWLTLKDPSCKPVFSDDRFAYFSFTVDSCRTTRTFFDNYLLYENEIALEKSMHRSSKGHTLPSVEYRHTISCFYLLSDTKTMAFHYRPRDNEPTAVPGSGQLLVQMRLSRDSSYVQFYQADDSPVEKYLREPLYFEVELESADPQLELILENCWATLHENRTSLPSWDIIVDGCENLDDSYVTVFHSVMSDTRVAVPGHVKRFSMKMFTFTKTENVLENQIYVHCDAVICETNNRVDGICSGQCGSLANVRNTKPQSGLKRGRRSKDSTQHQMEQISSGPILLKPSIESSE